MGELKNKIISKYNSLNSREKLIWAIGILLMFVIIYHIFLTSVPRANEIDYRNLTTQMIIEDSKIEYDRGKISSLNGIVENMLKLEYSELMIDGKTVSKREFYNATVTNNYKKNISFGRFKKVLSHINEKVYYGYENRNMVNTKDVINCVYYSPNYDMYLIELKENYEQENTYIGIRLTSETKTYSVVYLE